MADSDIQITEILYDADGAFGSDVAYEWVELFNAGPTAVSLDGWTISDGFTGVTAISNGFTLQPGQYGVVYNSGRITQAEFEAAYGALPPGALLITHEGDGSTADLWASMGNSGEQITLRNDSNTIIEQFTYPDTAAAGQSLELGGTDGAETFTVQSSPTVGFCFLAGTRIAVPGGERRVEDLCIGDLVTTAEGQAVPVKWLGRQEVQTGGDTTLHARLAPVLITAGTLGTHSDLYVSADHGMCVDGHVINASALVNGSTIRFAGRADLPEAFTYYHVETEHHDVILANGSPAETFVDAAGRAAFDNHQEYLDLYGTERVIPEMPRPRISAARHVPQPIKARLRRDGGPRRWTRAAI